jgi:signal transduction histidine kinase/ActR/RegA family two-component response regulator
MRSQPTIRRGVMRVALVTTSVALLINALALMVLDLHDYREVRFGEIRTQAHILVRASAAAIAFDDQKEAGNALRLLQEDASIFAAGVYLPSGQLFASYARPGETVPSAVGTPRGLQVEGDRIQGFYAVLSDDGASGTVYLSAHYGLYKRVLQYLGSLVIAMVCAFGIAILLSNALQKWVTQPILAVTHAARRVLEGHDYSVRADPQPGYETGVLADAFNQMLAEIHRRNDEIQHEMKERAEAEEALREADKRKDRFLATLAHELRNPLAPIMSGVQVLRLPAASDADRARARDVIDRQVRQMARLLDDLLDVGRITNDKLELRKQRVSLSTIMESAIEASRPLIEQAGHTLQLSMPDAPVELDADPIRIAQVLSNLLNNAAKYTNKGGHIRIYSACQNGSVRITVEDDGIGMTAEDISKLFDIFAQSASAAHLSRGGLGIGLFLVKSLTEMHGGTVSAQSDGPGKGSRFVVTLPVRASSHTAEHTDGPQHLLSLSSRKILVVDDNRDAAESLAAMLRIDGNEVCTSLDGASALHAVSSHAVDVAFIDIGMPGMNGYEVARAIRNSKAGSDMLLVALTGWGQAEDRRKALEAGFDAHLTKPARVEDIEAVLRQADTARS